MFYSELLLNIVWLPYSIERPWNWPIFYAFLYTVNTYRVVQEVNTGFWNTYMITGSLHEILAHGQVPLLKMLYVPHHRACFHMDQDEEGWPKGRWKVEWTGNPHCSSVLIVDKSPLESGSWIRLPCFSPLPCTHTDKFCRAESVWEGYELALNFSFKKNKGTLFWEEMSCMNYTLVTFKQGVLSQVWR